MDVLPNRQERASLRPQPWPGIAEVRRWYPRQEAEAARRNGAERKSGTSDPMMTFLAGREYPPKIDPALGPVVVGGVGGSGTRVVAEIMRHLGVYTGSC